MYPYLLADPTSPVLQVAGPEDIDYLQTFGDDATFMFIIEGCTGRVSAAGAQKRFDLWIAATGDQSVRQAVQADRRLTSRLMDDGSILTNQDPAADDLVVRQFRGYRRERLESGVEVLCGDFLVQVETSG